MAVFGQFINWHGFCKTVHVPPPPTERRDKQVSGVTTMFVTTAPKFRVTATAFAASMLGTALVFAIPQVAHAASSNSSFVHSVETQLNNGTFAQTSDTGVATVAVRIDANGKVLSAQVAGTSGHAVLDRQALSTAKSVSYPKGDKSRTVAVVLTFGNAAKPSKSQSASLVNRYVNAKGEALASQTPAPNAG
jgi:TonB family protein